MNLNVTEWRALHAKGYFKNHPYYQGGDRESGTDIADISRLWPLRSDLRVVVVGCGYGRESLLLAPYAREIIGIDIDPGLLAEARDSFLAPRGVKQFTPVLYREGWGADIPGEIDLVYSRNVFQHITRDITIDYLKTLSLKLAPEGRIVAQFCQCIETGTRDVVPGLVYEPQVNWTRADIETLCSLLKLGEVKILSLPLRQKKKHYYWHWLCCGGGGD
jgi:SAM-dependent methyltransferase